MILVACLIALIAFVGLSILAWLGSFFFTNDILLPAAPIAGVERAVIIFPHPDDEVNTAGLIHRLHQRGTHITLVVLTKGERGTSDAHLDSSLPAIRTRELQKSGKILGVDEIIHADFGDGALSSKRAAVRSYIQAALNRTQPDLIVSYDTAGLYGHPDHIACAEIVTELARARKTTLWYVTMPKRVLNVASLPDHMATDPTFKERRAVADYTVYLGPIGVTTKIRACYAHASQLPTTRKSVPFHLPLWFVYSTLMFEHYATERT